MNVTKRQLTVVLLATVLSLAACGSSGSQQPTASNLSPAASTEIAPQNVNASEKLGLWYTTDEEIGGVMTTPDVANIIFPRGAHYTGYRGEKNRIENLLLPTGTVPGNEAAEEGPWRFDKFELYYIGSRNTNREFAEEIYKTFIASANPDEEIDMQFEAYSPLNGKNFKITCENDHPQYVTCQGGIGAVIYIV